MVRSISISTEAISVLKAAQIEGNYVRLTGQIDRKLYVEVNEVFTRLGGSWKSGKIKAHVFPEDKDPAILLDSVVSGEMMPEKNSLAFFPTSAEVAQMMVEKACLTSHVRVLEPSAGEGAIAELIQATGLDVTLDLIEKDADRCKTLSSKGFSPVQKDFLDLDPFHWDIAYDCILMNPPFSVKEDSKAYITHALHAWKFVKDGGCLIAIAPIGFTFAKDRKSKDFREFVEQYGDCAALPDDAFKPYTGVKTVLIKLQKPV